MSDFNKENEKFSEKRHILENQDSSVDSTDAHAFDDIKQLIEGDEGEHTSTLPQASFNFINSIIGSGVIGIPYALQQAGFGLGLALLVFVAFVTDYSLVLMVRCGHLCGRFSYSGVMECAYGRPGYYLLSCLQFVYPFIAMVSYNVVVGDTLTKVLIRLLDLDEDSLMSDRHFIVIVCTVFVIMPLCLYKDIGKLARVSFISLACVGLILIMIMYKMVSGDYDIVPESKDSWRFANWDIIPSIGIMAFAFMCHHNTFLVYGSIQDPNQSRWDKVTHSSVGVALIVAILFGIAGYATFTAYSQGDLLENYCWDDDLMNFSRVLFSLSILFTFPIECFVTREVVQNMISGFGTGGGVPIATVEVDSDRWGHRGLTVGIIASACLLSTATDCLGPVLELNGVLAAVPLAYILPGIAYLKLEHGAIFSRAKLPALGLVLFGTVVALLGAIFMIINLDTVDTCNHGKIMPYCEHNMTNVTRI